MIYDGLKVAKCIGNIKRLRRAMTVAPVYNEAHMYWRAAMSERMSCMA